MFGYNYLEMFRRILHTKNVFYPRMINYAYGNYTHYFLTFGPFIFSIYKLTVLLIPHYHMYVHTCTLTTLHVPSLPCVSIYTCTPTTMCVHPCTPTSMCMSIHVPSLPCVSIHVPPLPCVCTYMYPHYHVCPYMYLYYHVFIHEP